MSIVDMKENLSPQAFAEALMEKGPMVFWKETNRWLVNDYDLAKAILLDARFSADRTPFFVRSMPNIDQQYVGTFLSVVKNMMVMADGKSHQNKRRICFHAFKPFMQQALLPMIHKKLESLTANKTEIDLAKDIGEPISMFMLAQMFAIPESEQEEFFKHAKFMTLFFGGGTSYTNETGKAVNHSTTVLLNYFVKLFSQNRQNAASPFIDILMQFQEKYDLTLEELSAQAIMMFVAGQVTTSDQMCNSAYQLMQPDVWNKIKQSPELLPAYVREATRLDPSVTFLFRVASDDMEFHGHKIKRHEAIFISNHAVNRNEHIFENPHTLDPHRPQETIFSYGFGPHYCLGEKLGLLEIETVMRFFLNQEKTLEVQYDDAKRLHYSAAFSGFERLPVLLSM